MGSGPKRPTSSGCQMAALRYVTESWLTHARQSIDLGYAYNFCDDSTHNWFQYQFFEASDVT